MKVSEIMALDCSDRPGKNYTALVKMLGKVPLFKEGKEISLGDVERVVLKIKKRYPITLAYIMPGPVEDGYYSFMVKRSDSNEWLTTIYARTMFEGFAKVLIYMYSYCKKNFKKE